MYPSVGVCCGMHEDRRRKQGKCWRYWGGVNVSFTSPGWRIGGLMAGWKVVWAAVVSVVVGKMEWYERGMQMQKRRGLYKKKRRQEVRGDCLLTGVRGEASAGDLVPLSHPPHSWRSFDCRRQALSVKPQTNGLCTYHRTITRRHVEPMADEQSLLTHAPRHDTDVEYQSIRLRYSIDGEHLHLIKHMQLIPLRSTQYTSSPPPTSHQISTLSTPPHSVSS